MTSTETNQIVRACLAGIVDSEILPEWELQTLTGFHRTEIAKVIQTWDLETSAEEEFSVAIGVLNNLLGYPGLRDEHLQRVTGFSKDELFTCLQFLRAAETDAADE